MKIISGEMKVVQADRSYLFAAGDTLLFPDLRERLPEDIATIKMEEGISILRTIDKDIDSPVNRFF